MYETIEFELTANWSTDGGELVEDVGSWTAEWKDEALIFLMRTKEWVREILSGYFTHPVFVIGSPFDTTYSASLCSTAVLTSFPLRPLSLLPLLEVPNVLLRGYCRDPFPSQALGNLDW